MPVWRLLLACCLLILPLALAAADSAHPIADSDVIGVLYGDAYTYGDLKVDDNEAARLRDVFPTDRHVSVLLAPVIVRFRQIVLFESVRRELPDCDVTASAAEVTEYIAWWQQRLAPILPHIESLRRSNPELENLETVEPAHEGARRLAKERILRWKVNKCLYESYGGSRMHGPSDMTLEHYRGERRANGFETIDNLMHPKTVRTADPFDAYLSHYNQLVAARQLMFPDTAYEELFFANVRNKALVFVPEEWEVEFVTLPYWRNR